MKISVSTGSLETRYGWKEALRLIRENGFDAVDYTLDHRGNLEQLRQSKNYTLTEEEIRAYYGEIRAYADSIGLAVGQTHALYGPREIQETQEYLDICKKSILATSILGSPYIVIHPFRTAGRLIDAEYEETFEMNLRFYKQLIPTLERYHVKVGIEPMWSHLDGVITASVCARPEEILQYIEILGSECFCACLDYGHLSLTGAQTNDTVDGAIRKLGKTMELIHVHETDGIHDSHTAPYTYVGFDWEPCLQAMKEIGYTGTFNYEVGNNYFQKKCPDALIPETIRHLAAIGRYMAERAE